MQHRDKIVLEKITGTLGIAYKLRRVFLWLIAIIRQ